MAIHPTALVAPGAQLDPTVEVGPFAIIGPDVKLAAGVRVGPHAVVSGRTTVGARTRIFQAASVGCDPQDLKYAGEPTELHVGEDNLIREFTTLSTGTVQGGGVTRIGNKNLFMAYSHVGHDCQVGSGCILANSVGLAGHVMLEDFVILGGLSGVHQFCRVGKHAFIAAGAVVTMDIPPYCTAQGDRAELSGLNTVGLARHGFTEDQQKRIKAAYRTLFRSKLGLREAVAQVRAEHGAAPEIEHFVRFIEGSSRGVVR
jgi:UDP-N-acetylglucosamine acyltransferase